MSPRPSDSPPHKGETASSNRDSEGTGERPDRLLRLPDVMARVGLKRSAIYERMNDGRFPRSRSLGPRCAVWLESEIADWIADVASMS